MFDLVEVSWVRDDGKVVGGASTLKLVQLAAHRLEHYRRLRPRHAQIALEHLHFDSLEETKLHADDFAFVGLGECDIV